jgi:hypothetical protein
VGIGLRLFSSDTVSFRLDVTNNFVFAEATRIINVPVVQLSTALNFGATE